MLKPPAGKLDSPSVLCPLLPIIEAGASAKWVPAAATVRVYTVPPLDWPDSTTASPKTALINAPALAPCPCTIIRPPFATKLDKAPRSVAVKSGARERTSNSGNNKTLLADTAAVMLAKVTTRKLRLVNDACTLSDSALTPPLVVSTYSGLSNTATVMESSSRIVPTA